MSTKSFLTGVVFSAATIAAGIWGIDTYRQHKGISFTQPASSIYKQASYAENTDGPVDFEKAATKAAHAVVAVRVTTKAKQVSGDDNGSQGSPFDDLFGDQFGQKGGPMMQSPERKGSGSGVLVSADGYIITNNHVIDGADDITVRLENKNDYKAKLVGRDPSTDLAVIKIEAKNLPYLAFANSDDTHLGQWVLAIGYPLGLETTVTSGIISAKSRSLGINMRNSKTPVEAFIQTDAAVNPGNSGGALVNTNGDVIGINSAIASPTGSYAGYSYAIPSNLVKKVTGDIMEFGSAKRAFLGVMYGNDQMSDEDRKANNIQTGEGVFVMEVAKGSAAEKAGVQKGDFITKINGAAVSTGTEMVEKIAEHRPGDNITITYNRNGTEKSGSASLLGESGVYASIKEQVVEQLGASFEELDAKKAAAAGINSGVMVKSLGAGILSEQTRIKEGFIITKVNDQKVNSVVELKDALKNAGNSAIISGVYPQQPQREYQYGLNDLNRDDQ